MLPSTFTILLYVPVTRSDFYGRSAFKRLMLRLKDRPIRYIVVGGGELDAPPGVHVENLGWQHDLRDAYERTSVLIRFTPRDGLSLMVLEALTYARHVLWTQDFMFTRTVRTYTDMEREVLALLESHERGELKPQSEAAAIVEQQYAPERCMQSISRSWLDAVETTLPTTAAVKGSDRTA